MKLLVVLFGLVLFAFLAQGSIYASATNSEIASFTSDSLKVLITVSSLASVLFIIYGSYIYITSTGRPEAVEHAKKTIRNALIGLVLVLAAGTIGSLLSGALNPPNTGPLGNQFSLTPIQPATPANGLTQVLIDAVSGFLQNVIQSAAKPLTDGIINFLTTTPALATNSVIFNFWVVILGITDSLFALIVALIGLQYMSATTFGFEELEFKQLLPRVALAFLGANTSIFLIDWVIRVSNTLVGAVLSATGGISNAWVLNAFNPASLVTGATALITLIFMLLFVILSIALLLFYISRLILVALGAVISPLIFLLWVLPKFSDFAEIAIKTYLVTIFSVFVHVVIIQLASSFLTIPGQSGTNSLISILVGIGLFFTLLKTPSVMMQLMFYTTRTGAFKKLGSEVMNVISSAASNEGTAASKVLNRK